VVWQIPSHENSTWLITYLKTGTWIRKTLRGTSRLITNLGNTQSLKDSTGLHDENHQQSNTIFIPEYKSHEQLGLDRRDGDHAPSRMSSTIRLTPGMNIISTNMKQVQGITIAWSCGVIVTNDQRKCATQIKTHKHWFLRLALITAY